MHHLWPNIWCVESLIWIVGVMSPALFSQFEPETLMVDFKSLVLHELCCLESVCPADPQSQQALSTCTQSSEDSWSMSNYSPHEHPQQAPLRRLRRRGGGVTPNPPRLIHCRLTHSFSQRRRPTVVRDEDGHNRAKDTPAGLGGSRQQYAIHLSAGHHGNNHQRHTNTHLENKPAVECRCTGLFTSQ